MLIELKRRNGDAEELWTASRDTRIRWRWEGWCARGFNMVASRDAGIRWRLNSRTANQLDMTRPSLLELALTSVSAEV